MFEKYLIKERAQWEYLADQWKMEMRPTVSAKPSAIFKLKSTKGWNVSYNIRSGMKFLWDNLRLPFYLPASYYTSWRLIDRRYCLTSLLVTKLFQ
jgi:hypothetical protein